MFGALVGCCCCCRCCPRRWCRIAVWVAVGREVLNERTSRAQATIPLGRCIRVALGTEWEREAEIGAGQVLVQACPGMWVAATGGLGTRGEAGGAPAAVWWGKQVEKQAW